MIVEQLKQKYQSRLDKVNYKNDQNYHSPTIRLFQSWAWRCAPKYYGFALEGVPYVWGDILDEFLRWVEVKCPDFRILQCKIKLGGLRFYVDLHSPNQETVKEVYNEICKLENWLQHPDLVY